MKIHLPKFLRKWSKKKIIWTIIILIVVLFFAWLFFGRGKDLSSLQTTKATLQNLEQTVLTTGQVVSGVSLDLSFQSSGIVKQVLVKEGAKVYSGQTLAILDQSIARANLIIAEGSFAQVKANYEKLLAGATSEDIKIVEDSVISSQQDLDNAYQDALTYLDDAYIKLYNSQTTVTSIKDTYFYVADPEGIKVQESKNVISQSTTDIKKNIDKARATLNNFDIDYAISEAIISLNNSSEALKIIRDMCDQGIYNTRVSTTDKILIDTQRGLINTGLLNVTNSQQLISSYKIALTKAENQLALKKASARKEDIDLYKAQMLSAEGQVASARATLNNTILTAPISGTITLVDTKIGQLATATARVMILQDISSLHTESDVSEANIASLKLGQAIDYTFDALGPDKHFVGTVLAIDPASTVISGVVNYKIKGSLNNIPDIKPGMTANMTIMVAKKDNVLAIPYSAVINKNKKQYTRIITDAKTKTFKEVEVQTGMQADGGLIEILSGLQEGQEVVTYLKS
jgi:HlyD family secretion protein